MAINWRAALAFLPAAAVVAVGLAARKRTSGLAGPVTDNLETWEREQRKQYFSKPAKDDGDCLVLGKERRSSPATTRFATSTHASKTASSD